MAKHFQGKTVDGVAVTLWPTIHKEAAKHPHFTILVMSEDEAITDRQRRWYKGICLKALSDDGNTKEWWDLEVKKHCGGLAMLKKETFLLENGEYVGRLTTVGVSRKNMTEFIENIISEAITRGWPVPPPDADLRRT